LQVRAALETTHRLKGENYVLWGGREGYDSLLNTELKRELDQYGRFLSLVVEHKHRIGFKGAILIEPKPFEPTKHQYDRDVATVHAFLQRYGLQNEVKVNIEVNHATLAGLDFEHEVAVARASGIFGSIDINRGDPRNGWDTDQFPNNAQELVPAMMQLIEDGGFVTGGFNFDAKVRRQSVDPGDLFLAHIGGMDTLARALLAAAVNSAGKSAAARSSWRSWPISRSRAISRPCRSRAIRNSPRVSSPATAASDAGREPAPDWSSYARSSPRLLLASVCVLRRRRARAAPERAATAGCGGQTGRS
jgi:xylose isomerase